MSNISIKKDFVDGDKLFSADLNNNFRVIETGVNANDEELETIIESAILRLDTELETILNQHIWTWNSGEAVTFYKGTTLELDTIPIKDGQILYNTATGETALDTDNERITTGSGNVVAVSDEEPTNVATKIWINPDEVISSLGTEVVDSMAENQTHRAPSVHAVKEYINGNVAEVTQEIEISNIDNSIFDYGGSVVLAYPAGFTQSNCYVIGSNVETPNEGVLEVMPKYYYSNAGVIEGIISYDCRIDGIYVSYLGNIWDDSDTLTATVLLMKIN